MKDLHLQSHLNIVNLRETLYRGSNRGNETCYLWQRSAMEKLMLDLSEIHIYHMGIKYAICLV